MPTNVPKLNSGAPRQTSSSTKILEGTRTDFGWYVAYYKWDGDRRRFEEVRDRGTYALKTAYEIAAASKKGILRDWPFILVSQKPTKYLYPINWKANDETHLPS